MHGQPHIRYYTWFLFTQTPSFSKFFSCSSYLYRFSKYVSYSFPIINFCNLGVHYKTPCILSNLFTGHPYKNRDSSVGLMNKIRTARSEVRTPAAAKYLPRIYCLKLSDRLRGAPKLPGSECREFFSWGRKAKPEFDYSPIFSLLGRFSKT